MEHTTPTVYTPADSSPASLPSSALTLPSTESLIYRRLAEHYLSAIHAGTLAPGARMPSVRELMRLHQVSLSTALQSLRHLETGGWLEARPRSGYFVRQPRRASLRPMDEPNISRPLDSAQFVGIHEQVSEFISRRQQQPPVIDLSGMTCAPELYAAEALKTAAMRALRDNPLLLTSVMPTNGNLHFRQVVARRALDSGVRISADEVVVTHGCIEALNLALRAVANAGDTIAVESPTYFGLLQTLESLGMRALEIPTSPQSGISIEALQLAFQTHANIKAVVVVPTLQNPLGCIMSDAHKQRLVEVCEQHRVALIEDDAYSELTDTEVPPAAAKAWDRSGNVIHCVSLNKVLAPGMRLGWISSGKWHERVKMLKFAHMRASEEWTQITAANYMASPAYDRHLRRLRATLKQQREQMAEAIAAYFPQQTRLNLPRGGIGLWIELPDGLCSKALFKAALEEGIGLSPGIIFSNSHRFDHYVRLSCGKPFNRELDQAIRRLGMLVTNLKRST